LDLRGRKWQRGWRRPHNKELNNLYASQNIRMIKSRRLMGWSCSTDMRWEMRTEFWLKNLKGRDHSEDLSIDWREIIEWILER